MRRPTSLLLALLLPSAAFGQTWSEVDVSSSGVEVFSLATADVNADGRLDILAGTQSLDIQVHFNTSNGFVQQATTIPLDNDPMALATGDIDGDGDIDVAYGCRGDAFVGWAANNGDGTFAPRTDLWQASSQPTKLVLVDADEDGDLDLAHLTHATGVLAIAMNDGTGGFGAPEVLVASGVRDFAFADVGAFGQIGPDVMYVTDTGTFTRRFNAATSTWAAADSWGDGVGQSAALLDIDDDSFPDAVYWSDDPAGLIAVRGTSQGWNLAGPYTGGMGPLLLAGNISADGNVDLIEPRAADGAYWVHHNRGVSSRTSFEPRVQIVAGALQGDGWDAVHLFDFDGDCDDDLLRDDRTNGQHMVIAINPDLTGDRDGDGVPACWGDCDDDDASVGSITTDADCDGYVTTEDCDDHDPNADHRGIDGDCDGLIGAEDCDDADPDAPTPAQDADCDGAITAEDCDDDDPARFPFAPELCDGIDNDCDGIDDDPVCDEDTDLPPNLVRVGPTDEVPVCACASGSPSSAPGWLVVPGAWLLRRRRTSKANR